MIKDTTVLSKDLKREIDQLVGKPFGFIERLKMDGVGSHRMSIAECSEGLLPYLQEFGNLTYCNVELRPNGILIHISKRNSRYSWIIPYYKLSIFRSGNLTFHAEGEFIRVLDPRHLEMTSKFISKLLEHKTNWSVQNSGPN